MSDIFLRYLLDKLVHETIQGDNLQERYADYRDRKEVAQLYGIPPA